MNKHLSNLLFKDVTYYIEKYFLSSFMLYFALKNLILVVSGIDLMSHTENEMGQGREYYPLVEHSILFAFNAFDGCILLCSKRPQQAPQSWGQILIPLLSSYFMLSYNLTSFLPAWMTSNYIPQQWLWGILTASCLFVLGGELLGLVAVLYLRRSFAVFVQVRDVVLQGPYRYVRHPIYMGHSLLVIGVLLSNVCIAYALISVIYIGLLAYRARLEETVLAANDPAYRKNMERTGFLFPKLSNFTTP